MKNVLRFLLVMILLLNIPSPVLAHPGRLDSMGGHTCQTNCLNWGLTPGEYHYHSNTGYANSKNEFYLNDGTRWFSDIPTGYWAYSDIKSLNDNSIVSGFNDSTFRPSNPITRAEAIKMIITALNVDTHGYNSHFFDVKPSHWAYDIISYANSMGIIYGYQDGLFKPNNPITRAEIVAILSRSYDFEMQPSSIQFVDILETHWAYDSIELLSSNNIIKGYSDGTFGPNKLINRAEFSAMLNRIIK